MMPPIQKNLFLFIAVISCFIFIYLVITNGLQTSSNLSKWLPNEIRELQVPASSDTHSRSSLLKNDREMLLTSHQKLGSLDNIDSIGFTPITQYSFLRLAPSSENIDTIPPDVALNVRQFLLLVGPENWGMTFVQRLVNMHPHALLCKGVDLRKFEMGIYAENESKKSLVNDIYGHVRKSHSSGQLLADGLETGFQKGWSDQLAVVGSYDIQNNSILENPSSSKVTRLYVNLKALFGSVKILSVSRNPYEMILDYILVNSKTSADKVTERPLKTKVLHFDNQTKLYNISHETLAKAIEAIEKQVGTLHTFLKQFNVKVVQAEDFFTHSKLLVVQLCAWLDLECFEDYKNIIERGLKTVPRKLRENFFWPSDIIHRIDGLLKKYPRYFMEGSDYLLRNL